MCLAAGKEKKHLLKKSIPGAVGISKLKIFYLDLGGLSKFSFG
jgi:hypothetical protein